jgi:hypothetical protein
MKAQSVPTSGHALQRRLTAGGAVFSAEQGDGSFARRHFWQRRACRFGGIGGQAGGWASGWVAGAESGALDLPPVSFQADETI